MGKVYLIGAGCGSYELLTIRGMKLIEKADCIVYDRLIDERILDFAPSHAEKIYLGKGNTEGGTLQQRINDTLVAKAKEYDRVVRLKGGDSFVFGRGGEELDALIEAGFDFEMVPGISSSLAAPQFAGIPVTNRGDSRSFHVFTAHFSKPDTYLDFKTISALEGTLIFLMGVGNLERIVNGLMEHGKDQNTAIALIQKGARTRQCVVEGQLHNIVAKAKEEKVVPPAIIIVGDVVKLREKFNWYERLPLHNKKILVTRGSHQQMSMVEGIERLGGEAVCKPMLKIEYANDPCDLQGMKWVLFNSPNGVHGFFSNIKDIRSIAELKFGVVGDKTREALESYRIQPDAMPKEYMSGKLIEDVIEKSKEEEGILVCTSQLSPLWKTNLEEKYGRKISLFKSHDTLGVGYEEGELDQILNDIDIITFLSGSAVDEFFKQVKTDVSHIQFASIGPQTSEAIKKYYQPIAYEAKDYSVEGILEAITCSKEQDR